MAKTAQQQQPEALLEYKAKDGAWYAGTSSFTGVFLRVHFQEFPEEEDEYWRWQRFKTEAEVRKAIRPCSQPMQDFQCASICEAMVLCVACRRPHSRLFEYYDAKVLQVKRCDHSLGSDNEELCKCRFQVEWIGGPHIGKSLYVSCGDICILTMGEIEDDPALRAFLEKVKALETAMTVCRYDDEDNLDIPLNWSIKRRKSHSVASTESDEEDLDIPLNSSFKRRKTYSAAWRESDQRPPSAMPEFPLKRKLDAAIGGDIVTGIAPSTLNEDSLSGSRDVKVSQGKREYLFEGAFRQSSPKGSAFSGELNNIELMKEKCLAEFASNFPADFEGKGDAWEGWSTDEDLTPPDCCDQDSILDSSSDRLQITTATDVEKHILLFGISINSSAKKCDCGTGMDRKHENLDVSSPQELNINLNNVLSGAQYDGITVQDKGVKDPIPLLEKHVIVERGTPSKEIPSFKGIQIIDLEAEEEAKPVLSKTGRDDSVHGSMMQEGLSNEVRPSQVSANLDLKSANQEWNKKGLDTKARSGICVNGNQTIPSSSVVPNHTVADRDLTDSVLGSSDGTCIKPTRTTTKHLDTPVVNSKSLEGKGFEVEDNTPHMAKRLPKHLCEPTCADQSGNNDACDGSSLDKEHVSHSCMRHISSCSCTAFQSCSCTRRNFHECSHVGVIHMGPLHMQTKACGHAPNCHYEWHNHCNCSDLTCPENLTWRKCCGCASLERFQGSNKQCTGHDGHAMKCQRCKEQPGVDDAKKTQEHSMGAKFLSDSQILLVENLEKDITPSNALKIVLEATRGATMVYIWPSLEYETTRKGYICYKDSQTADAAYSDLLGGEFLIVSSKGRPWVISRANLDLVDWNHLCSVSSLATLKGENEDAGVEGTTSEHKGLSILYSDTGEFALALAKRRLFLEQKKELRLCYHRFSKEENDLESWD